MSMPSCSSERCCPQDSLDLGTHAPPAVGEDTEGDFVLKDMAQQLSCYLVHFLMCPEKVHVMSAES